VLKGGVYRKHVEDLRSRLTRARRVTADKLRRIGIEPWLMPRGGFQLWCRLPEGCDSAAMARAALEENVVLAPGNVFSAAQSAAGMMRFNVAHCDDPRLMAVLERAMER
jgi:DNA-binding transcriptional MocR family regulator